MARTYLILLLGAFSLSLLSCGEQGDSSKVSFEVVPQTPVIIDAPITINPGGDDEKLVDGAFFILDFKATNNSDRTLVIQTLIIKMYAWTDEGKEEFRYEIDPGEVERDPVLTELATILPGTTFQSSINEGIVWYFGGLPGEEENVRSFVFNGEVNVVGFFLDSSGQPADRLYKHYYFSTQ